MAADMTPPPGAAAFLARAGWAGGAIEPLAGDASFRRYFRVRRGAATAVLMDAPPPHEDVRPFLAIASHLARIGLSSPRALAAAPEAGLVLLEDFGNLRLTPLLASEPEREIELYALAADLLGWISHQALPEGIARYDLFELRRELLLFTDWYLPSLGVACSTEAYLEAWHGVLAHALCGSPVLTLRDFHADNLMWLPGRRGALALGLLDFQDALAGHPAYDLVSLLQDARRNVGPRLEQAMLEQFLSQIAMPAEMFRAAYAVLGAQRATKILGIFTRLWKRDGKPGYLGHMPRVWRYLERDLAHPALAPVRAWFDANVPASARAPAWDEAA